MLAFTVREAEAEDMPICAALRTTYTTSAAWQFSPESDAAWARNVTGRTPPVQGVPLLHFHLQQVRLPRLLTLALPSAVVPLAAAWESYELRLVADVDDYVCGLLCVRLLPDQQQGMLARMLVDPAVRRRGLGRGLLHAALAWARQQGLLGLRAHVPLRNVPGHDFYLHNGFRVAGLAAHFYPTREDALLLLREF